MRLLHYLFCFLLTHIGMTVSTEYTYPVASCDNGAIIFYIKQTSAISIEPFKWDTRTGAYESMLWSVFNPGNLQLLPDNTGFSFIDNGRFRIKQFHKRSPKTIDFDEPIFNIGNIHWIDEHSCYCHAQYQNHFALFELHDDGSLCCLMQDTNKDCMYPQKIDNALFYIERSKMNNHYCVMQTEYIQDAYSQGRIIIDFQDKPIIFLSMLSAVEGFIVEHQKNIEVADTTALFFYHHLIKVGTEWHKNELFSFAIPWTLLLDHNERLFESVLPLLPRMIDNNIYFADCTHNSNNYLETYCYEISIATIKKVLSSDQGHFFVPMKCGNRLYCGGSMCNQKEPPICFLT